MALMTWIVGTNQPLNVVDDFLFRRMSMCATQDECTSFSRMTVSRDLEKMHELSIGWIAQYLQVLYTSVNNYSYDDSLYIPLQSFK